jgi:hypothetical protein
LFRLSVVMPGHSCPKDGVASLAYVPGIHVLAAKKTWMAGTSPRLSGSFFVDRVHDVDSSVF